MQKRGLSPVIATVLLIGMVIVLGAIVYIWFTNFIDEGTTKDGKRIELACQNVEFKVSYDGSHAFISNIGNVGIYQMKAKVVNGGSHETITIDKNVIDWPENGLNAGQGAEPELVVSGEYIVFMPVLVGTNKEGEATHTCDEQYGKKLNIL